MGWTERITGRMTQSNFIHGSADTQEITLHSSDPWTNGIPRISVVCSHEPTVNPG